MQKLTVIGRRWFEKTNGNTYHSVEVYEGNKRLVRVPFAYGYGSQWQQTAFQELVKLGLYQDTPDDYRRFHFSDGDGHLFSVTDVARKKDL